MFFLVFFFLKIRKHVKWCIHPILSFTQLYNHIERNVLKGRLCRESRQNGNPSDEATGQGTRRNAISLYFVGTKIQNGRPRPRTADASTNENTVRVLQRRLFLLFQFCTSNRCVKKTNCFFDF